MTTALLAASLTDDFGARLPQIKKKKGEKTEEEGEQGKGWVGRWNMISRVVVERVKGRGRRVGRGVAAGVDM